MEKGSAIDEYSKPEPMDYIVDEEQFCLETLNSHTQYLAQLSLEENKTMKVTHVEDAVKSNTDVAMRGASVKRTYTRYSDRDNARFFKLLFEKCLSAADAAARWLGIHVRTAHKWIKLYESNPDSIFEKQNRNSEEKIQERLDWIRKWEKTDMNFTTNCVFLDESVFHINLKRNMTWSKKGSPTVVTVPKTRAKTTTILDAISAQGLIKCSLRLPQPPPNKKRKRGEGVGQQKYIESRGYRCAYLPSYSPELNPIEQFWSVVQIKVKRNKFLEIETLMTRISKASNSLKLSEFKGFVGRSHKYGLGNQYDNNGNEVMDVQMEVDNEMYPIEKVTNFDIYIDLKPSEKEAEERNNSSTQKLQKDDEKGSYKHYKDSCRSETQHKCAHSTGLDSKDNKDPQEYIQMLSDSGRPVGRPPVLTDEYKNYMIQWADENTDSVVLEDMLDALTEKFGNLRITRSGFYKFVRQKCRITFKKAHLQLVERNTPEKIEQCYEWIKRWMETGLDFTSNCVFMDEAAFHINLKRNFSWSKEGSRAVVKVPRTRAKTTTILGAISPFGVVNISVRRPRALAQSKKRKVNGGTKAKVSNNGGTVVGHYFNFISSVLDIMDRHEQFRGHYLRLAVTKDGAKRNVILAIEALFSALKDLDIGHLRELELAASFIHPLIQALLSYENDDKVARCTNTLQDNGTDVSRRPDYEVMMYEQYQPSYRTCFGEIKGEGSSDTLSIMDFYRLGVFAKLEMVYYASKRLELLSHFTQ
ncbi:hypothetical protein G6F44_004837 [Rhizopus delemar]|nr:hypothetical protein G6F44_004837 [Rhizopus delemar]